MFRVLARAVQLRIILWQLGLALVFPSSQVKSYFNIVAVALTIYCVYKKRKMSVTDSEKIGSESAIQDKEVQGRNDLTLKFPDDEKPQPFNELEIQDNSEV